MSEPTRIGDILVRRELVDPHGLRRALSEQPAKNQRLVSMLITQTLLELDDGALALSELSGYPAVLESDFEARDARLAHVIPLDLVRTWAVIPLARASNGLLVVCARDPSPMLAHALREELAEPVALAIGPAIYIEKIIRAVCKVSPDVAPAFLPATIDRPPPGWARRGVAELLANPPDPAALDTATAAPMASLQLELDTSSETIELSRSDVVMESEPALILSTLSAEERHAIAPEPVGAAEPLPLSSIGIGVPPSDPAIITDPDAPVPDPAAVPMSYTPHQAGPLDKVSAQHAVVIPRSRPRMTETDSAWDDPEPEPEAPTHVVSSAPSRPSAGEDSIEFANPLFARTSTSVAFVAEPRISTASTVGVAPPPIEDGWPVVPASHGTEPPPIAEPMLARQPAVIAQARITTASTPGFKPLARAPSEPAPPAQPPARPTLPPLPSLPSLPSPPSGPGAIAREIERALSRATADRLVIKHAATHWKSSLLLTITNDVAQGSRGQGARIVNAANVQIAFERCALLRDARDTKEVATSLPLADPLLDIVGAPAAAAPVVDGDGNVVAIVAGGEPTGDLDTAVEHLAMLAAALGAAYRRF